jgi:hypothetical protein
MSEPIEKRILGESLAGRSPSMSRVALKDCLEAHDLIISQRVRISGLGDVPPVITTYDAEGGFVFKRIRYATTADLVNDLEIQRQNATAAQRAYEQAKDRNALLLPVMDDQGFDLAGEAVAWLEAQP